MVWLYLGSDGAGGNSLTLLTVIVNPHLALVKEQGDDNYFSFDCFVVPVSLSISSLV